LPRIYNNGAYILFLAGIFLETIGKYS